MSLEPKLSGVGAGGATAANQTNGNQRTIRVDGTNTIVPSGTALDPVFTTGGSPIPQLDLGQIYEGNDTGVGTYTDIYADPQPIAQLVDATWVACTGPTAIEATQNYAEILVSIEGAFAGGGATEYLVRIRANFRNGGAPVTLDSFRYGVGVLSEHTITEASGVFPGDAVHLTTQNSFGMYEWWLEIKSTGIPIAGDEIKAWAKAVPL